MLQCVLCCSVLQYHVQKASYHISHIRTLYVRTLCCSVLQCVAVLYSAKVRIIKIKTNVGLAHASVKGKIYGEKKMENPKTYDKQLQKLSQIYVVDLFGPDGSWIFGKMKSVGFLDAYFGTVQGLLDLFEVVCSTGLR